MAENKKNGKETDRHISMASSLVCDRATAVAQELGLNVEMNPPSMIAEDFSRYLKLSPGALFRIGTGGGFDNHHPSFTSDPSALLPAARFFAALAQRELERLTAGIAEYAPALDSENE